MNIQLPTGNTISISIETYLQIDDNIIDLVYQSWIADNLGIYIDNPFSNKHLSEKLEIKTEEEEMDDFIPDDDFI